MQTFPSRYRRELLPPASTFYKREFPKLGRPTRGWSRTGCCFHHGQNPTSLALNLETGGFYCHACGAKGGDLIDFLRLRDGLGFEEAARRLGAWSDSRVILTRTTERDVQEAVDRWERAERQLRHQYREEIHLYNRISVLFQRLLRKSSEDDTAWAALSDTLELLRRATAGYYVLSFATMKVRWQFLQADPTGRERMIDDVLNTGFLLCENGRLQEVVVP